jgi:acetyl-CoA synthetase
MFEGIPTYPDASRFWQVIDKHQVNSFYTAPTAIRALMGAGDGFVAKTHRSSLRIFNSNHLHLVLHHHLQNTYLGKWKNTPP